MIPEMSGDAVKSQEFTLLMMDFKLNSMKLAVTMFLKAEYLLYIKLLVQSQSSVLVMLIWKDQVQLHLDLDSKIAKYFGVTMLHGQRLDVLSETEKITNL